MSIGGALEEHWRTGGGSEEGWRRIGKGLEEDASIESIFDRFSIDFRGLGKGCRSIGGPLEEHWRAGGGSGESWMRVGG